jgi:hypothetical protein
VHVGNGEPLNNNPPGAGATCANPATTLDDFACWVDYEHSPLTYMSLLGLTPVDLEDHSMDLTSISSANHPRLEEKARALRHK